MLIDTGANVSLIKVNKLENDVKCYKDFPIYLRGIDNVDKLNSTIAYTYLDFYLNDQRYETLFHIIKEDFPIDFDGILGNDILKNLSASIDFENDILSFIYDGKLQMNHIEVSNRPPENLLNSKCRRVEDLISEQNSSLSNESLNRFEISDIDLSVNGLNTNNFSNFQDQDFDIFKMSSVSPDSSIKIRVDSNELEVTSMMEPSVCKSGEELGTSGTIEANKACASQVLPCLKELFDYIPLQNENYLQGESPLQNSQGEIPFGTCNVHNTMVNKTSFDTKGYACLKHIIIQPRCEQIIELDISNYDSNLGILNKQEIANGVFIPNSLVKVNENKIITSVLNTTDKSIELINIRVDLEPVANDFDDENLITNIYSCNSNKFDSERIKEIKTRLRTSHLNKE